MPDARSESSSTSSGSPSKPSAAALQGLLGDVGAPRRGWRRALPWLGLGVAGVLAVLGWNAWQSRQQANAAPVYVTEEVRRGDITLTVTANGTLQPTRAVNLGSELSGTVRRVLVDVNDRVRQGQVLVELDTAKLSAQVQRSRAAVAVAQARLAQVGATVKETQAQLARQEEVARLSQGMAPSQTELDAARAALARAQADEASARASVQDAQAALFTDETNLGKASIRSPIDGVVLSRTVEPGVAVAAALQAVTLMTLAEDLTRLRLDASVDEADVGAVQLGQSARFTVSAYPARQYPAKVTRVAFGSTKTDNVVTYITWLDVDNRDLSLRPGMTASATITATERKDVLLVPNTALRFTPRDTVAAAGGGGIMSQLMPRPPRSAPRKPGDANGKPGEGQQKQLWLLQGGSPVPKQVTVGISDGRVTEVRGEGLEPGMAVVVDQRGSAASSQSKP